MTGGSAEPIAVVGTACEYPDATDPAQLWEIAIEGRRGVFRKLPSEVDRTYSAYAAVLDGWECSSGTPSPAT